MVHGCSAPKWLAIGSDPWPHLAQPVTLSTPSPHPRLSSRSSAPRPRLSSWQGGSHRKGSPFGVLEVAAPKCPPKPQGLWCLLSTQRPSSAQVLGSWKLFQHRMILASPARPGTKKGKAEVCDKTGQCEMEGLQAQVLASCREKNACLPGRQQTQGGQKNLSDLFPEQI